mgnify:CR=1 FL=1
MEWSLLFVLNSICWEWDLRWMHFLFLLLFRQSRYFRRRNLDFYRTGNLFERSFLNFNRKIPENYENFFLYES